MGRGGHTSTHEATATATAVLRRRGRGRDRAHRPRHAGRVSVTQRNALLSLTTRNAFDELAVAANLHAVKDPDGLLIELLFDNPLHDGPLADALCDGCLPEVGPVAELACELVRSRHAAVDCIDLDDAADLRTAKHLRVAVRSAYHPAESADCLLWRMLSSPRLQHLVHWGHNELAIELGEQVSDAGLIAVAAPTDSTRSGL